MKKIGFIILSLLLLSLATYAQDTKRAKIKVDVPWTLYVDTTIYVNWTLGEYDASWMTVYKFRGNTDSVFIHPTIAVLPEDSADFLLYPGLDTVSTVAENGAISFDDVVFTGTDMRGYIRITDSSYIKVKSSFKYKVPKN